MKFIWNGESGLANQLFGDNYGIDWEYIENSLSIILKSGRVLKVGEFI